MEKNIIKLYKYTSCETASKILVSNKFSFSHPNLFNDPFDGHIRDVLQFDPKLFRDTFYEEAEKIICDPSIALPHFPESPDFITYLKDIRDLARESKEEALNRFKKGTEQGINNKIQEAIIKFSNPNWSNLMKQL